MKRRVGCIEPLGKTDFINAMFCVAVTTDRHIAKYHSYRADGWHNVCDFCCNELGNNWTKKSLQTSSQMIRINSTSFRKLLFHFQIKIDAVQMHTIFASKMGWMNCFHPKVILMVFTNSWDSIWLTVYVVGLQNCCYPNAIWRHERGRERERMSLRCTLWIRTS